MDQSKQDKKFFSKRVTTFFVIIAVLILYYLRPYTSRSVKNIDNEIVLKEGMIITVKSDWATIEIEGLSNNKRKYTWDGQSVIVDLIPRNERWYGSHGLYHPQVRPPHSGVVHMIVEEGQQHFQTVADAMLWIEKFLDSPIYNDSGLVVCTRTEVKNSSQKFVGITIWQIYVDGKTLSPYKEEGFSAERLDRLFTDHNSDIYKTHKKIYLRKHYVNGIKPNILSGSQNSRITVKFK